VPAGTQGGGRGSVVERAATIVDVSTLGPADDEDEGTVMESVDQTMAKLRQRLGREPTPEEIKVARDAAWKRHLEDRFITELTLGKNE
jgi:hypothetical protein